MASASHQKTTSRSRSSTTPPSSRRSTTSGCASSPARDEARVGRRSELASRAGRVPRPCTEAAFDGAAVRPSRENEQSRASHFPAPLFVSVPSFLFHPRPLSNASRRPSHPPLPPYLFFQQEVATFGFRGEALSSLCAASDLSVVTRRRAEESATKLTFDHEGSLLSREPAARAPGTTVCAANLFARMPVRRSELLRQSRRELGKAASVLQAYAIFSPGVRFLATHHAGSTSRSTLVSTRGSGRARECLVEVLGPKAADGLEPVDFDLGRSTSVEGDGEADGDGDGEGSAPKLGSQGSQGSRRVRLVGYVSKASAAGRKSPADRQYFAINGRPVDLPRLVKVLNECFRALASPGVAARPACVLDLRLPRDAYDVNVTPDKRTVFLHDERRIVDAVREALKAHWEPSRSRYKINGGGSQAIKQEATQLPFSQFLAAGKGTQARAGAGAGSRGIFGRFSQGASQRDDLENQGNRGGDDDEQEQGEDGSGASQTGTQGSGGESMAGTQGSGDALRSATQGLASVAPVDAELGRFRAGMPPPRGPAGSAEVAELEALADTMEAREADPGEISEAHEGKELAAVADSGLLEELGISQENASDAVRGSQGAVTSASLIGVQPSSSVLGVASQSTSATGRKRSADAERPPQAAKSARTAPPPLASFLMGRRAAQATPPEAAPEAAEDERAAAEGEVLPDSTVGLLAVDVSEGSTLLAEASHEDDLSSTPRGAAPAGAAAAELERSPPSPTYSPPKPSRDRDEARSPSARRELLPVSAAETPPIDDGALSEGDPTIGAATVPERDAKIQVRAVPERVATFVAATDNGEMKIDGEPKRASSPMLEDTDEGKASSEILEGTRPGVDVSETLLEETTRDTDETQLRDEASPSAEATAPSSAGKEGAGTDALASSQGPNALDQAAISLDAESSLPRAAALPPCAGVVSVDLAALSARVVRKREARRAARRGDASRREPTTEPQPSASSPAALAALTAASLAPGHDEISGEQSLVRATEELELSFDKADFCNMVIVGQFNLGFIVTRLGSNLFVVDQHASDEKSTFERLQGMLKLQRQPLLFPVDLGLSPSEELTVREHPDVFALNGFTFREDPETGRLALSATPLGRKSSNLGPDDVRELIGVLQGDDVEAHGAGLLPLWTTTKSSKGRKSTTIPRPSRVRAMLASKACRSSVMIGKALTKKDMRRIVDRLSELESPWNCPHGRPTMRHLYTLARN